VTVGHIVRPTSSSGSVRFNCSPAAAMTAHANAPKRKCLRATDSFRSPDAPLDSLTAGGAIELPLQIEPPVKREAVVNLACRVSRLLLAIGLQGVNDSRFQNSRSRCTRCLVVALGHFLVI